MILLMLTAQEGRLPIDTAGFAEHGRSSSAQRLRRRICVP